MTTTQSRILVIEHQGDAGIGLVGEHLRELGVQLAVVGPDTGVDIPDSLDNVDGLIVLGGSMGPDEDDKAPWLPATRALLAEAVAREVPTLGICLGAQLLTSATGGRVQEMPQGPEVGLHSVHFAPEAAADPLFGALADVEVPVLQWHWLEAERLPDGAKLLASSEGCVNQAFRLGSRAWGVQFHPEALGGTASDWVADGAGELAELGISGDDLVSAVRAAEPQLRDVWGRISGRFAEIVAAASTPQPELPISGGSNAVQR